MNNNFFLINFTINKQNYSNRVGCMLWDYMEILSKAKTIYLLFSMITPQIVKKENCRFYM